MIINESRNATANPPISKAWRQERITLSHAQIKNVINNFKNPFFFDSGLNKPNGRYDILCAEPENTQKVSKTETLPSIYSSNTINLTTSEQVTIPEKYQNLPFVCGWLGFSSYEFGAKLAIEPCQLLQSSSLPSLYIARYTWSYVYDHKLEQGYLTFSPQCDQTLEDKIQALIKVVNSETKPEQRNTPKYALLFKKSIRYDEYRQKFNLAKRYIKDGDCYQVNLAQRFEAPFKDSPLALYFELREKTNTPYSGYFSLGPNQNILCFSPEKFIGIHNRLVESKPIKGTIENNHDEHRSDELRNSIKDKAENLMIVDLLRNDLSKICKLDSVKVEKLFKLETFNNVHHLVSHIKGALKDGVGELEAFFSCFPGGSITGAPKKRAMEIINELEISGRDAYCGSVFYLNDNGNFDSNILIRTIVHSEDKLFCWGGGAITDDSKVEEEYLESLIKVKNITNIEN